MMSKPFTYTPAFQKALTKLNNFIDDNADKGLTKGDVQDYFKKLMQDLGFIERIQNLYRIRDKLTGKYAQFNPRPAQLKFLQTKTGADIILKARQIGFTTLSAIYAYDRAIWDGWVCGMMAHNQDTVKTIFEIVKNANFYFKQDWGKYYAPEEEANNTTRLSWKDLKSSVTVAFQFRGYTLNMLHVSEAAFIGADRLVSSLQAVPENGETILESTANGPGGYFYSCWQEFRKNPATSPFKGHFFPWFEVYPEIPDRWQVREGGAIWSPEEEALKAEYNLQDYHLLWRRNQILKTCNNSEETFEVEYPSNDIACFLSGENNVYARKILLFQERFVKDPLYVGSLKINDKKVEFYEDSKNGLIKIWQLPKGHGVYYGGADPSGGLKLSGGDPGCAIIIDASTGEQVAELHGFLDPDLFADELYKLGQFYNRCFWCIESNNHGEAVILKLKNIYTNLYRRQVFDEFSKRMSSQIGFNTSPATKLTVTDNHVAACRDGQFLVRSKGLHEEMASFVQISGKVGKSIRREARVDCHDDRVMAACLAYEMLRSRPITDFSNEISNPLLRYEIDPDSGFTIWG